MSCSDRVCQWSAEWDRYEGMVGSSYFIASLNRPNQFLIIINHQLINRDRQHNDIDISFIKMNIADISIRFASLIM